MAITEQILQTIYTFGPTPPPPPHLSPPTLPHLSCVQGNKMHHSSVTGTLLFIVQIVSKWLKPTILKSVMNELRFTHAIYEIHAKITRKCSFSFLLLVCVQSVPFKIRQWRRQHAFYWTLYDTVSIHTRKPDSTELYTLKRAKETTLTRTCAHTTTSRCSTFTLMFETAVLSGTCQTDGFQLFDTVCTLDG